MMGEYWSAWAGTKKRKSLTPDMRADGTTNKMDRCYGAQAAGVYEDAFARAVATFEREVPEFLWPYARESSFGNPHIKWWMKMPVSLTSLDFAYVLSRIFPPLRRRRGMQVVEIGAGFGGLARTLLSFDPTLKITLVDLGIVSRIQAYYLSNVGFSARLISEIPDEPVDVIVSTRAMCEFDIEEVNVYLDRIGSVLKRGGIFYCVSHDEPATTSGSCQNRFQQWRVPPGLVLKDERPFPFYSFKKERKWTERRWRVLP